MNINVIARIEIATAAIKNARFFDATYLGTAADSTVDENNVPTGEIYVYFAIGDTLSRAGVAPVIGGLVVVFDNIDSDTVSRIDENELYDIENELNDAPITLDKCADWGTDRDIAW